MVTPKGHWSGPTFLSPLSLPTTPRDGESLIGLVARATRRNVLANTRIITGAVGRYLNPPAHIAIEPGDWSGKVARIIGCTEADIESRRIGNELKPDPSDRGRIPTPARDHLELKVRRFSPASLAQADHHRSVWLYRHLPYCPESLELLIDRCASCGAVQRWGDAWGIGHCDVYECRRPLTNPAPTFLPRHLVDGYRRFADLLSPDPSVRAAALANMPPDLAAAGCREQVQSVVRLGSLFVRGVPDTVTGYTGARRAVHLPAEELAEIVSTGATLLLEWPKRLRGEIAERLADGRLSGLREITRFSRGYRKLSLTVTRSTLRSMFEAAVPETKSSALKLAGIGRRTVKARQASTTMGILVSDFARLWKTDVIKPIIAIGGARGSAIFDADEIDRIADRWKNSYQWSVCANRLKIPVYAMDQLVALGLLWFEDHPVCLALDPNPRIASSVTAEMYRRLLDGGGEGDPGADLVPLHLAMRAFTGLKPWGHVVSMLLSGELPYWNSRPGRFDARHALVDPRLLANRDDLRVAGEALDVPERITLTATDAAEILMLTGRSLLRAVEMSLIRVSRRSPLRPICDRAQILRLAREFMPWPEVRRTTGLLPVNTLAATGVSLAQTFPIGLLREDVLAGRLPVIKAPQPQWSGRLSAADRRAREEEGRLREASREE